MNGKERISRILNHEKVDRIGFYEHFWNDTYTKWREDGYIGIGEDFDDHFGFDISGTSPFNLVADINFEPVVVAETEDTITYLDGNGATLKRHKHHDTTPEHIDFSVKEKDVWEEKVKPLLKIDPDRINFEAYRKAKQSAEKAGRFFVLQGVNVFELMHPVCGHEHMLAGMVLDPDWVKDMAATYSEIIIGLQKLLFEKEGKPDGIWYYEDMGYKGSPFMSPDMYNEIIKPSHKKTINYAKSLGLPVIMHSCGYIEPLLPGMIEAGIDCLQVIEVKAGMDLLKLHKLYGDKISFIGGIDVRCLYNNDLAEIDAELTSKIPFVKEGYNFVLHSDHSIPSNVNYNTYKYFIDKGLALGKYY